MAEPEQTLIKSTWPSIPNKVDAAYENPEKDVVIVFSGEYYYYCNIILSFLRYLIQYT